MKLWIILIELIISCYWLIETAECQPQPTQDYSNRVALPVDSSPDQAFLFWTLGGGNTITMEIHSKNTDWIVLGLEPSGSSSNSINSDWIVTSMDWSTGLGHFSDRYLLTPSSQSQSERSSRSAPLISDGSLRVDPKRAWLPMNVQKQSQSYSIFKFSRKFTDCELGMLPAAYKVHFSYGNDSNNFNTNDDIRISNGYLLSEMKNSNAKFPITTSIVSSNIAPSKAANTACPINLPASSASSTIDSPIPFAKYANMVDLVGSSSGGDDDGGNNPYNTAPSFIYRFYWNVTSEAELIGELHAQTTGWIGFGLSPNGHMAYSDVVIGWIKDGKAYFTVI
jgi:hypothetical protein